MHGVKIGTNGAYCCPFNADHPTAQTNSLPKGAVELAFLRPYGLSQGLGQDSQFNYLPEFKCSIP
eukprot:2616874-Amphidinium_carterae.3